MSDLSLSQRVRKYWEARPCGTGGNVVGELTKYTPEWFAKIEEYRYRTEPFIHSVAQFTRYRGKKILEIGVGAGTDHLQWARAGAQCFGVDLTDAAIEITREHLRLHGLESRLQRVNAEQGLPFDEGSFDVVYSWGVIHHAEHPKNIVEEIRRVLKPGGLFIGMMYGRRSPVVFKVWLKEALLRGKPWRSFRDVVWHHVESVGTKAYTCAELRELFIGFSQFEATPIMTPHDRRRFPDWLSKLIPNAWGWFIAVRAVR